MTLNVVNSIIHKLGGLGLLPIWVVGVSGHRQNLALPWAPAAGWLPKVKGRETGLVLPTDTPTPPCLFQGSTIPINQARPNRNLTLTRKEPIG